MQLVAGPIWILATLLAFAGAGKLVRPAAATTALRAAGLPGPAILVRVVGLVELVVGVAVLWFGGRLATAALALVYAVFAAFLVRLRSYAGAGASCACLGARQTPVTGLHIGLDVTAAALAAATAAAMPLGSGPTLLAQTPWHGVPAVAALVLAVALTHVLLTQLPPMGALAAQLADREDRL